MSIRARTPSGRDARLAVELYPDPESESWGFRVPALGIVGGAKTRAAALRQARDAANFTLESGGPGGRRRGGDRAYLSARVRVPTRRVPA